MQWLMQPVGHIADRLSQKGAAASSVQWTGAEAGTACRLLPTSYLVSRKATPDRHGGAVWRADNLI